MICVFAGAESADHRRTLISVKEMTDEHMAVSISYRSLRSRRLGPQYVKDTAKHFSVVLESGAARADMTREEALKQRDAYYDFLEQVPEVTYAIQFEHPSLLDGDNTIPEGGKIVPILLDPTDAERLEFILDYSGQVAMAPSDDKRVPAILRSRTQEDGLLVSLAQSDLAEARASGFSAVITSAWNVPGRYGDPVVWDGNAVQRYKKKYREDVLKSHRKWLDGIGVDFDLLESGDSREWNRVAVRSYLAWSAALTAQVTDTPAPDNGPEPVSSEIASATSLPEPERRFRATVPLPVFSQSQVEALEDNTDGTSEVRTRAVLRTSGDTLRVCDSCFLASTCPAHEPGANCAFHFPVEVRTDLQVRSLLSSMVEMQASRVAFARFAEEVNGGYPDPVVGQEMDRLFSMADRMKKSEERRERLTVSVEAESSIGSIGAGGVLSSIFGSRTPPPRREPEMVVIEAQDVSTT